MYTQQHEPSGHVGKTLESRRACEQCEQELAAGGVTSPVSPEKDQQTNGRSSKTRPWPDDSTGAHWTRTAKDEDRWNGLAEDYTLQTLGERSSECLGLRVKS